MKGFKQFLMRGNIIDLAVAVVIGAAFNAVVTSFVKDLLTPLIAAIAGKPDFSNIVFTVNGSRFLIGNFMNALIAFLLASAAIYYAVVFPLSLIAKRRQADSPTTRKCPECLSDIPLLAKRCSHCTGPVPPLSLELG